MKLNTAERLEAPPNCLRQITTERGFLGYRRTQSVTRFLFHRTARMRGAHTQALPGLFIQVANS